jgi:hypothetical protein
MRRMKIAHVRVLKAVAGCGTTGNKRDEDIGEEL